MLSNLLAVLAVVVFLAGCATGTMFGMGGALLVASGITFVALAV